MDRTERFYKIDKLLRRPKLTTMADIIIELEVSKATVKRDLAYLRDRMNAPIIWDSGRRGYCYADAPAGQSKYSLPGLWFDRSEIYSLLIMENLIRKIQPDFLSGHIDPLRERVRRILRGRQPEMEELAHRIRIVSGSNPPVESEIFRKVAEALLTRKQIFVCHLNRTANVSVPRHISPQRLVYYNEKWYLDSWCHLREGLRTFRLSYMTEVEITDDSAVSIGADRLDAELQAGFGIFVGVDTQQAELRFSARLSPWIQREHWHSHQTMQTDDQGRLTLTLPFSNDPELIMRILSYGPDVEVLQPADLRAKISVRLQEACALYET